MSNSYDDAILADALPRLTPYQRRAVKALAAGRAVASPLSHAEAHDMIARLGGDVYNATLDTLGFAHERRTRSREGASRQAREDALQGISPARRRYMVCTCHGRAYVPGDVWGGWYPLPYSNLRHARDTGGAYHDIPPVRLYRHDGYMSLEHEYGPWRLTLAGQEQLWRLFYSVRETPGRRQTLFSAAEDNARMEGIPVALGEVISRQVFHALVAHRIPHDSPAAARICDYGAQAAIRERITAEFDAAPWQYPHTSANREGAGQ